MLSALHLLMSKLAAVFDNITIKVKWLLHPFQGNLTCTLNAGDGHIIDNYSPEEWVLSSCMLQQHIIDVNNILYMLTIVKKKCTLAFF